MSLYFLKKCNIVNIKIMLFFIGVHCNSFFSKYLFFEFIGKCQKEIWRYTPPPSYVCGFNFKSIKNYLNAKIFFKFL